MKNVNEIRKFARKGLNTGKDIAKDGLGYDDIGKVIGLIDPGRDAFEDAAKYMPELGVSTNQDMDASDAQLTGMLGNFSAEDQRDFDAIEKGIVAVTRKIARARQEGIEEGKKLAFAAIKAGKVDVRDL